MYRIASILVCIFTFGCYVDSSKCTDDDAVKLLDAGYTKYEINDICETKSVSDVKIQNNTIIEGDVGELHKYQIQDEYKAFSRDQANTHEYADSDHVDSNSIPEGYGTETKLTLETVDSQDNEPPLELGGTTTIQEIKKEWVNRGMLLKKERCKLGPDDRRSCEDVTFQTSNGDVMTVEFWLNTDILLNGRVVYHNSNNLSSAEMRINYAKASDLYLIKGMGIILPDVCDLDNGCPMSSLLLEDATIINNDCTIRSVDNKTGWCNPQCVEYVNCRLQLDHRGDAAQWWDNPPSGYKKYTNGSVLPPSRHDIVIWTDVANGSGHVAVVDRVDMDEGIVYISDTNFSNNYQSDCMYRTRPLSLDIRDDRYYIQDVTGWLKGSEHLLLVWPDRAFARFEIDPTEIYGWNSGGLNYSWNVKFNTNSSDFEFGFYLYTSMGAGDSGEGDINKLLSNGQFSVWQATENGNSISIAEADVVTGRVDMINQELVISLSGKELIEKIFSGYIKDGTIGIFKLGEQDSKTILIEYQY